MKRVAVLRSVAVAGVVAAAAGILVAVPSGADAAVRPAIGPQWGIIEGIGGVNMRSGPGTNYSIVGHANNQQSVTVYCWNPGTTINGDPYWDWLYDPANGITEFVADAYVYTAGDITTQVEPCVT